MKRCQIHNIEYNYTCPACNYELRYAGVAGNSIEAFRLGVNNKPNMYNSMAEIAAYEEGIRHYKFHKFYVGK